MYEAMHMGMTVMVFLFQLGSIRMFEALEQMSHNFVALNPPLDTASNARSLSFSILFLVTLPTAKSLVKDLAALVTSDFVIAPLEPLYTSMAMSIRYMQQIPVSMQFNLLKKFIPSLLGLNFVMENITEFKAILCYNSLNNFESLQKLVLIFMLNNNF
jgi:hypothetical protein